MEPPPGAPWVTMAGVAGAAPDEFSLGRKGHDLVLALIYCVAFRKSLSFSRPLVKRWARSHPTSMGFCPLSQLMSSCVTYWEHVRWAEPWLAVTAQVTSLSLSLSLRGSGGSNKCFSTRSCLKRRSVTDRDGFYLGVRKMRKWVLL